ncbi:hypothetical protein CPL00345_CDS0046 [Klebsiella phage GlastoCabaret]
MSYKTDIIPLIHFRVYRTVRLLHAWLGLAYWEIDSERNYR